MKKSILIALLGIVNVVLMIKLIAQHSAIQRLIEGGARLNASQQRLIEADARLEAADARLKDALSDTVTHQTCRKIADCYFYYGAKAALAAIHCRDQGRIIVGDSYYYPHTNTPPIEDYNDDRIYTMARFMMPTSFYLSMTNL